MQTYANPKKFLSVVAVVYRPLWLLCLAVLAVGLYLSFTAPEDYQQGEAVRIMFIHVPSAWLALFIYSFVAGASLVGLIWRHPLSFFAARAAAPIGATFTLICLVSGGLWGQPIWGTWWVWDARLTSALILFFIYLGYSALWHSVDEPLRAAKISALFALLGFVNIPIVKFSVDWWHTLHQPASLTRFASPAIHIDLLIPLLVMAGGFVLLFFALWLTRLQAEILRQRLYARGRA